MNEKVRKVFDLLGVEPNEEFGLVTNDSCVFRVNERLIVQSRGKHLHTWNESLSSIVDILNGVIHVVKIPQLTEADKNAIRYLRDGGIKYVARDFGEFLYGFKTKPQKIETCWIEDDDGNVVIEVFDNLFQFVQWTDEEPFCIEDLEV